MHNSFPMLKVKTFSTEIVILLLTFTYVYIMPKQHKCIILKKLCNEMSREIEILLLPEISFTTNI